MDARELTTLVPRLLIRLYQSVRLGSARHCRFYPTCSEYAAEALKTKGLLGGLRLGVTRLLRCHPWNPGGYDPIVF